VHFLADFSPAHPQRRSKRRERRSKRRERRFPKNHEICKKMHLEDIRFEVQNKKKKKATYTIIG